MPGHDHEVLLRKSKRHAEQFEKVQPYSMQLADPLLNEVSVAGEVPLVEPLIWAHHAEIGRFCDRRVYRALVPDINLFSIVASSISELGSDLLPAAKVSTAGLVYRLPGAYADRLHTRG